MPGIQYANTAGIQENTAITRNFTTANTQEEKQAFFDSLSDNIYGKDITVNFAAGIYSYASDWELNNIKTIDKSKILIKGLDSRLYLGTGFFHGINPDDSGGLISLSLSSDTITMTPALDFVAAGYTNGDKLDLYGKDSGGLFKQETVILDTPNMGTLKLTAIPSIITDITIDGAGFIFHGNVRFENKFQITCPDAHIKFEKVLLYSLKSLDSIYDISRDTTGKISLNRCNIGVNGNTEIFFQIKSLQVAFFNCSISGVFSLSRCKGQIESFFGVPFVSGIFGTSMLQILESSDIRLDKVFAIQNGSILIQGNTKCTINSVRLFLVGKTFFSAIQIDTGAKIVINNTKTINILIPIPSGTNGIKTTSGGKTNINPSSNIENWDVGIYTEEGGKCIETSGVFFAGNNTDRSPAVSATPANNGGENIF